MKKAFLTATCIISMGFFQSIAKERPLASLIQAPTPTQFVVVESRIVKMPENYSNESRDINFCYAFTAANLINQMLYATQQANFTPVSIIDIAVYGSGMGAIELSQGAEMKPTPILDDFGNEYKILVYNKFVRKTATESCAPFKRLKILQSSNPNRGVDYDAFVHILQPVIDAKKENKIPDYSSVADGILVWEPNLKSSKEQVIEVLKNNQLASFEDFLKVLGRIVVPNSCKEKAISLPKFEVALAKIDSTNRAQVTDYFISIINRERPLGWEFCIDDECKAQHVLVIYGWRKLCTQDMKSCQTQFMLRDSGTQVTGNPGDYWVDKKAIDEKIELMFKNYDSLQNGGILPNRIVNIEYQ